MGKLDKSKVSQPRFFHLLEDKQLLPSHHRYHVYICWWYWGDRGLSPAQVLSVEMDFSACSGPHRNSWSLAGRRSHSKDIAFIPQSKRATSRSTRKTIVQHIGQHTQLTSCHWDCPRLPVKVSSYLKCSIAGVRPSIALGSVIFHEHCHNSYMHDPDLCMVLFHPLTSFILKASSSMVFHSYLLGMQKTSSLAHSFSCQGR